MRELICGVDYFVRHVRFPNRANPATVVPNDDGTFDIYLNTLYPPELLLDSLAHEVRHLEEEHFYVEAPIRMIESRAEGEDPLGAVLRPPEGLIACFRSETALARWLAAVCRLRGIRFPDGGA